MKNKANAIVIGGGIIGLSIGIALLKRGISTKIIEAHEKLCTANSFRNSAVIHSGIYYENGSLKARFCREGAEKLFNLCMKFGIKYHKIGKIIVATTEEQARDLVSLKKTADTNGVSDVRLLTGKEVSHLEENVKCHAGLLSPSTGIIDIHHLIGILIDDFVAHGGEFILSAKVTTIHNKERNAFHVEYSQKNKTKFSESSILVNSAGIYSPHVSQGMSFIDKKTIPTPYYAKGNYFKLVANTSPFSRLIYPMPESAGLGIHATMDINNVVRFGPDVQWIDDPEDNHVSLNRKEIFVKEIEKYFPNIAHYDLAPEYAGIRPKIKSKAEQPQDFRIDGYSQHGQDGLVMLYGIESPGLTASLAIADYVAEHLVS